MTCACFQRLLSTPHDHFMAQFENTAHPLSYFINSVRIPTSDCVKDENPTWLDSEHISKYRSHVAICLFFSQDRTDNILRARVAPKNDRSITTQIFQVFDFTDMSSEGTSVGSRSWDDTLKNTNKKRTNHHQKQSSEIVCRVVCSSSGSARSEAGPRARCLTWVFF